MLQVSTNSQKHAEERNPIDYDSDFWIRLVWIADPAAEGGNILTWLPLWQVGGLARLALTKPICQLAVVGYEFEFSPPAVNQALFICIIACICCADWTLPGAIYSWGGKFNLATAVARGLVVSSIAARAIPPASHGRGQIGIFPPSCKWFVFLLFPH